MCNENRKENINMNLNIVREKLPKTYETVVYPLITEYKKMIEDNDCFTEYSNEIKVVATFKDLMEKFTNELSTMPFSKENFTKCMIANRSAAHKFQQLATTISKSAYPRVYFIDTTDHVLCIVYEACAQLEASNFAIESIATTQTVALVSEMSKIRAEYSKRKEYSSTYDDALDFYDEHSQCFVNMSGTALQWMVEDMASIVKLFESCLDLDISVYFVDADRVSVEDAAKAIDKSFNMDIRSQIAIARFYASEDAICLTKVRNLDDYDPTYEYMLLIDNMLHHETIKEMLDDLINFNIDNPFIDTIESVLDYLKIKIPNDAAISYQRIKDAFDAHKKKSDEA